jgi:hypothetical protein
MAFDPEVTQFGPVVYEFSNAFHVRGAFGLGVASFVSIKNPKFLRAQAIDEERRMSCHH